MPGLSFPVVLLLLQVYLITFLTILVGPGDGEKSVQINFGHPEIPPEL